MVKSEGGSLSQLYMIIHLSSNFRKSQTGISNQNKPVFIIVRYIASIFVLNKDRTPINPQEIISTMLLKSY